MRHACIQQGNNNAGGARVVVQVEAVRPVAVLLVIGRIIEVMLIIRRVAVVVLMITVVMVAMMGMAILNVVMHMNGDP